MANIVAVIDVGWSWDLHLFFDGGKRSGVYSLLGEISAFLSCARMPASRRLPRLTHIAEIFRKSPIRVDRKKFLWNLFVALSAYFYMPGLYPCYWQARCRHPLFSLRYFNRIFFDRHG